MSLFIASADSRETSVELMEAILEVSGNNPELAEGIWSSPSHDEIESILDIISAKGHDPDSLVWGDAGYEWWL